MFKVNDNGEKFTIDVDFYTLNTLCHMILPCARPELERIAKAEAGRNSLWKDKTAEQLKLLDDISNEIASKL